jgi:hypothetical protein
MSSTLLLDLMDFPYGAHIAVHFPHWTLPIPGYEDLIIDPATFGDIVYVLGVSGFPVDASFYYDVRRASQYLDLVHSDIFGPMTTCYHGGAKYFFIFFDVVSIYRST